MSALILNPLEEYEKKYKHLHAENAEKFFEKLVSQSGIDIEKNRETVKQYELYKENLVMLKKKLNIARFFRVLMCVTVLLIPLVVLKTTPKIRALRAEIALRADAALRAVSSKNSTSPCGGSASPFRWRAVLARRKPW